MLAERSNLANMTFPPNLEMFCFQESLMVISISSYGYSSHFNIQHLLMKAGKVTSRCGLLATSDLIQMHTCVFQSQAKLLRVHKSQYLYLLIPWYLDSLILPTESYLVGNQDMFYYQELHKWVSWGKMITGNAIYFLSFLWHI